MGRQQIGELDLAIERVHVVSVLIDFIVRDRSDDIADLESREVLLARLAGLLQASAQQTVNLLSFKNLPKDIFDTQLSFNLLARYGEEAPVSLEESELRIERHLASLLALPGDGEGAPMPSLRLIQAPVFHGYSFSAWVEFVDAPDMEALESSLSIPAIEVRGGDFEPPTNVGQAGQGGIAVGAITPDRNNAEAAWLWFVADNVRLAAENAVAVARELV